MRAIWCTDIHLEFLDDQDVHSFFMRMGRRHADAVLISGDIAQAPTVVKYLGWMEKTLQVPIYFVLGNHDYYHGSIPALRATIREFLEQSPLLHWLSDSGPVRLSPTTCLIGHDGWGDARLGDPETSTVDLNDFYLISELSGLAKPQRLQKLRELGDEAAAHFLQVLPEALKSAEQVVVLTHVPPFWEAAWYQGQPSDSQWLPFFSCKAVGDVLLATMRDHPDKRMTVLCGHTHGGGRSELLPNLVTLTGPARYGRPVIQEVLEWT
jgi:Icc protein